MKTEYDILVAPYREALIKEVNFLIEQGWEPLGAPFIVIPDHRDRDYATWCQAVRRSL